MERLQSKSESYIVNLYLILLIALVGFTNFVRMHRSISVNVFKHSKVVLCLDLKLDRQEVPGKNKKKNFRNIDISNERLFHEPQSKKKKLNRNLLPSNQLLEK